MLTITDSAGARLTELLAHSSEDTAVRIVFKGHGMKLRRDHTHPDDATLSYEGKTVLLLDEQISERLAHRTLVVRETDQGPKLTLQRTRKD